jgi:hypothetical protein
MRHSRVSLGWVLVASIMLGLVARTTEARNLTFETGSLIIPMDTTYQPLGLFKAFGLIDKLLLANVPVHWAIKPGKMVGNPGDADFAASVVDVQTGEVIASYGYRGGPFIVEAANATVAGAIVAEWQKGNVTVVHRATATFDAPIGRTMTAAPTIGVFADGNENIAFGYLNAAGILDRNGKPWPNGKLADYATYPDVLTEAEVAGPSYANPRDGRLFDASGVPVFCQIMTMHWQCKTGCGKPDALQDAVVAEMAEFLRYPTHVFAECQAVTAIERNPNGRFVAPDGVWMDGAPSNALTFRQSDLPFAQMDGPYQNPGGSEPSYALCDPAKQDGDAYPNCAKNAYYDNGIVMITQSTTPLVGVRDVWMTGYARGTCTIELNDSCGAGGGKVSYLGGHAYTTALPLSKNPKSQGTRLFLNSLFEASCTVSEGQPLMYLEVIGPEFTSAATVTYTIRYGNDGGGTAGLATLDYALPVGTTFVSATEGGTLATGHVTWSLGNVGGGASASVEVTINLGAYGAYTSSAILGYRVGLNQRSLTSDKLVTKYGAVCIPVCSSALCGISDGCGGLCGADGGCCTPSCAGRACGASNGCTGTCAVGSGCTCTPRCAGVPCGSADGCGSNCAPGSGCVCTPQCAGVPCGGDDGCGSPCQPGAGCECTGGGCVIDAGAADAAVDAPYVGGIDAAVADVGGEATAVAPEVGVDVPVASVDAPAVTGDGSRSMDGSQVPADAGNDAAVVVSDGPSIADAPGDRPTTGTDGARDAANRVAGTGSGCGCHLGSGRTAGAGPAAGLLFAVMLVLRCSRKRRRPSARGDEP